MANTDFKSVDEYIAAQPAAARPVLERVRQAIRKALPKAEEVISYQIAGYKLGEARVVYFAGWKEHYSLYPATKPLLAEFDREGAPFEVKSHTLRFRLDAPVPAALIGRIVRFRAAEEAERLKAKAAKKRKRSAGA